MNNVVDIFKNVESLYEIVDDEPLSDEEINLRLKFLDHVREGGTPNMFTAAKYLQQEFDLTDDETRDLVELYVATFEDRHEHD